MASSISITKDEFRLVRKVFASTIHLDEHVGYMYERRVIANGVGADSYGMITGPIKRKSMIMPVLRSDKQGGIISSAEYNDLAADIASSLTL